MMTDPRELSLLRPPSVTAHHARLLAIALRLDDAFKYILNSPIINQTGIQDEDFRATVTETRIFLQIPERGLSCISQLNVIANRLIDFQRDSEYDYQITLYAPTFNMPSEFIRYKEFFDNGSMNYRMSIRFVRR